jgi:hypothetical protein
VVDRTIRRAGFLVLKKQMGVKGLARPSR